MKTALAKLLHYAPLLLPRSIADESSESVFTNIYKNAAWGTNEVGEGSSGLGSRLENAKEYVTFLQNFMQEQEVNSVVDVGCGDWGLSRYVDWKELEYQGYDVVKEVIEKNQAQFSSQTIRFHHADVLFTNLPAADLMICKDMMQHLRNDDILSLLYQVHKFKHCLITNDVHPQTLTSKNNDLPIRGGHRYLDLCKPPFNVAGTKILTYVSGTAIKQVLYIKNI
jgi:SAM-dependent methyltransferase